MSNGRISTKGCQILSMPNGRTLAEDLCFYIYTSRKPVRCRGKLLKIKSKLILIPFTFFFFWVVQNVIGKIYKETLRIKFRMDFLV